MAPKARGGGRFGQFGKKEFHEYMEEVHDDDDDDYSESESSDKFTDVTKHFGGMTKVAQFESKQLINQVD
jgi:hypothetical protein